MLTTMNPNYNYSNFAVGRKLAEDDSVNLFEEIFEEFKDKFGEDTEPLVSACLLEGMQIWI